MRQASASPALVGAWMLVAALGFAQDEGLSSAEFKALLANPDSHVRHQGFLKLNGDDKKQLSRLLDILKSGNWYDREAAIVALARTANAESLAEMAKAIEKDKNYLVRQGLCIAFAKMNDEDYYPHIFAALEDKDPRVRREAAYSLRINRKKDSITALVERWQKEDDPVVSTFIRATLEDITRRYHGPDPVAWKDWWDAEGDSFVVGSTDEEAERLAELEGNKMKTERTVTRNVTLETQSRGHGAPLLVIPPYGYSKEIIVPFLTKLEQSNKIYYIDLPEISSFTGLDSIAGVNYYPIDKLVEAFEQLRKDTGEERFAIMAWEMNSWIALRYAAQFPQSVSHVVLVTPISSNDEYGKATERMIKKGKAVNDREMWHFALTRSFNTTTGESSLEMHYKEALEKRQHPGCPSSAPDGEGPALDRRSWAMMFANEQDSLLSLLYPVKDRILGSVAIPDFSCFKEPRPPVRMLFIAGQYSLYSSVEDVQEMGKHYGASVLVYKGSSCMPHAEESERFNDDLEKFLSKGR